jgi:tetratricopeptide (TPR) repeat protein
MTGERARLERALRVWLEHRASGGRDDELLARHVDLADLLAPMLAEAATESPSTLGDYILEQELGRGGMGVVYRARHASLDRTVALKVLADHVAGDPNTLVRFRREALHLSRLRHPGIVDVLGVGEANGRHWLAMAFVDGETLQQRLAALQEFGGHRGDSRRVLVAVVAQIAEALAHAHAAGIVHRDVKPANVFLRRDGQALLGDFGLSRSEHSTSLTREGVVAGTPDYMAPEQIRGEPLDGRTDVFALGATLYECLTLVRPFRGGSIDQVLQRIEHGELPSPRRLDRGIPVELEAIVTKALEKRPADRYPDASAFAADLRAFLELRPISARPPSRPTRLLRWVRREPWRAAGAFGVLGAVVAAALLLAYLPDIRAAARDRDDAAFTEALANSLLANSFRQHAVAEQWLERAQALRPESAEAEACMLSQRVRLDGAANVLAAIERSPNAHTPPLQRMRVRALQGLGRDDEALQLEAVLPVAHTDVEALLWIGSCRHRSARSEQGQDVLTEIENAMRRVPRPLLALWSEWAAALPDNRRTEAAQALLRHWPTVPVAKFLAANMLLFDEPARSRELVLEAIAGGVELADCWRVLAVAELKLGNAEQTRAALAEAMRRKPSVIEWQRIASIHERLGDRASWIAASRSFVAAFPAAPEAQTCLGSALLDADDEQLVQEGIAAFRAAAEAGPQSPEWQYNYAVALHATYRDEDAVAQCHRVLNLEPGNERAHERLISILTTLRQESQILVELERWVTVRTDDAKTRTQLANIYLLLDRSRDALRVIEEADYITRGESAAVSVQRAAVHAALGEPAAEARYLERAAVLQAAGEAKSETAPR